MLTWYEENGKFLGFDDDTYIMRVFYDEAEGWTWENIIESYGICGYDTAEEAKQDAEEEYAESAKALRKLIGVDETPYTLEEAQEILNEMLYEQAKEQWLFG